MKTLACGSCSHSISRSPKLPLVFLWLNRNTVHVFYFLSNVCMSNASLHPFIIYFSKFTGLQPLWFFLVFFVTFQEILEMSKLSSTLNHCTATTALRLLRSTTLSSVRRGSYLTGWPNTNTLCCNDFLVSFHRVFFISCLRLKPTKFLKRFLQF